MDPVLRAFVEDGIVRMEEKLGLWERIKKWIRKLVRRQNDKGR